MTINDAVAKGAEILRSAGIEECLLDARLLLGWCMGKDRSYLYAHPDEEISREIWERYQEFTDKRAHRIPLQHITGEQDFMGMTFKVNNKVLIPRQDTEILVEEVMRELHDGMAILDLCTGSGCILTSLLRYSNGCVGLGVDVSEDALAIARDNAALIPGEDIAFARCDILSVDEWTELISGKDLERYGRFDIITANPPYIEDSVIDTLMPEVRDHDPRIALSGGEDGLVFYRRIALIARDVLKGGGMLFLEIGADQGRAVTEILSDNGYRYIEIIKDYAGLDRVVRCQAGE